MKIADFPVCSIFLSASSMVLIESLLIISQNSPGREAWSSLRPGGHLVNLINYGCAFSWPLFSWLALKVHKGTPCYDLDTVQTPDITSLWHGDLKPNINWI